MLETTGDEDEPGSARGAAGGAWRARSKREGRCARAPQCVSALELDFALLTSCTFPPVTKSKYTHALKRTVTRSELGASRPRWVGQRARSRRIKWSSHNMTLQGKSPGSHSYNTRLKRCLLKKNILIKQFEPCMKFKWYFL